MIQGFPLKSIRALKFQEKKFIFFSATREIPNVNILNGKKRKKKVGKIEGNNVNVTYFYLNPEYSFKVEKRK